MKQWIRFGGGVLREATRHLLRRPVVGVAIAATTETGLWLLVRRGDTGGWALPGGTVEWGETIQHTIGRELLEEAGARLRSKPQLLGVYSAPQRDYRFHAVTVLAHAKVEETIGGPANALEIREARLFARHELPSRLSLGMTDMLADALNHRAVLE